MSLGSASNFFLGAASAGSGAADGPIKSVRFNSGDSAYLNRTPSSASNRKTWTWSGWVKRSSLTSSYENLFSSGDGGNNWLEIGFTSQKVYFYWQDSSSGTNIQNSDSVHRDCSAWMHLVVAVDTTQSSASDRLKIYVNGSQITMGGTNPTQDFETAVNNTFAHGIGSRVSESNLYFDGYLADIYLIDGSALDPTSFGAYDDNNVWQATKYSGTFGTNGFHLFDFANETTLGNDSSGNNNDFTANNLENVTSNNTNNVDNIFNITQLQNNGANQTINLANLRTMMNSSNFQDADTDNSTWGVRVGGASKKFGVKWSSLTGLTGVSVRWQRASTYDADVKTTGTGITESTDTVTSSRTQVTFSTTATSGEILFEDVTSGSTNGFYIRAIEFKGYGSVTYPTNAENFVAPGPDQDVLFDVPTNGSAEDATGAGGEISANYATWNALDPTTVTFSEGNLKGTSNGANYGAFGTIGVGSGKWYWEQLILGQNSFVGITDIESDVDSRGYGSSNSLYYYGNTGTTYGTLAGQSAGTSVGATFTTNDIIGTALDMDNGTVAFYKNGKLQSTLTPPNGLQTFVITAAMDNGGGTATVNVINFGQRPWTFAAPTNYKALCTSNLSTPTIPDGSDHFDTVLRTADTSQVKSITGLAFSPDVIWEKPRSVSQSHYLSDTVRSVSNTISPDSTAAESSYPTYITSSNSDGYTIGTGDFTSGTTIVAWTWDGGNLVTTSDTTNYNQNQTWSDLVTGTLDTQYGNSDPAVPFNGDTGSSYSDGIRPTSGNYLSMNFGTTFSSATSVKIFGHASLDGVTYAGANENLKINGTAIGSSAWADNGGGSGQSSATFSLSSGLTSLEWGFSSGSQSTGYLYLQGIEVDGKLLLDLGVIPAGGMNSSVYDQSQRWRDYLTSNIGWATNYEPYKAFNAVFDGDGGAATNGANGVVTFTPPAMTVTSLEVNVYSNSTITLPDGTTRSVAGSSTVDNMRTVDIGSGFSFTGSNSITFTPPTGVYTYIERIKINGKELVDDDVTPGNVPLIPSTVRANTEAGFSIVSYTGNGTSGHTVAHGLNAVPEFILTKRRDSTGYWPVYHKKLSTGYALQLDATAAQFAGSQLYTNTAPTSSVFSVGNNAVINADGGTYISYCFTGVEGYSKFGLYNGNGDASDGNFVFLPFRPAFLLIKDISTTGSWYLTDGTRNPTNDTTTFYVWANSSAAEQSDYDVDLLSNGFMLRTSSVNLNADATNYVYAAFAKNPFQANGGLAR